MQFIPLKEFDPKWRFLPLFVPPFMMAVGAILVMVAIWNEIKFGEPLPKEVWIMTYAMGAVSLIITPAIMWSIRNIYYDTTSHQLYFTRPTLLWSMNKKHLIGRPSSLQINLRKSERYGDHFYLDIECSGRSGRKPFSHLCASLSEAQELAQKISQLSGAPVVPSKNT